MEDVELVRVLGEKYNVEILCEMQEPKTVKEVSEEVGIPIATSYRRVDDLLEQDLLEVDGKTVYYTIAGPMRLGAMVAGATKEQLDAIFDVGTPLGRCFQIRDDLLNLQGDREKYGKEIGGDILEGKRTLMLGHLLRNADEEDRKRVEEIMKKPREEKTREEAFEVIDLMEKYGSIEYVKKMAEKFAKEAKENLEKLDFLKDNKAKEQLKQAIDFILKRGK